MKIRVTYMSRFYLVVIPSLIIIAGLFIVPYLNYRHPLSDSTLAKLALNIGGFILVIVVTVLLYRLMKKIARLKKATIAIDGTVVSWRTGLGKKAVDLSKEHTALVFSGPGLKAPQNSSLYVGSGKSSVNISLMQMERHGVTDIVRDEDFVEKNSIPAEEGTGGFNLEPHSDNHRNFFTEMLKLIWSQRDNNLGYEVHLMFPWGKDPNPQWPYARVLDEDVSHLTVGDALKIGQYVWLTADHLLVHDKGRRYYLMPLGKTGVRIVTKAGPGGTSQILAFHDAIQFDSIDDKGEKVTALVPEAEARQYGDREYLKKQCMIRFVNSRYGKQ